MEFDENAQLDTSQVEDRRGRGGLTGGLAMGGGGLGIIGLLLAILFGGGVIGGGDGVNTSAGPFGPLNGQTTSIEGGAPSTVEANCRTGADANAREDCRIVAVVNSVQKYWTDEFARRGERYQPARTRFFTGGINTGCGAASSASGPFYCPLDQYIYIDLGFFDDLRTRFGASGGPFAQAYVIAHEYGHHVENLIGVLERSRRGDQTGPQGASTRVELMADCFAGVWAANAVQTGFIKSLSDRDIQDGLNAAAAVGDDRIQKATQGRVDPESWTHGSAEQRQRWFLAGYQSGNMDSCDTFRGNVRLLR